MIRIGLIALLLSLPAVVVAQEAAPAQEMSDEDYQEFLAQSPFNKMYPKAVGPEAAKYFGEFNKLFSEGAIAPKEARLVAVAASAAIRCEYCIMAQVHLARKAGASEDEIKTAIQISAEVARFSILLYGNEFDEDELKKILNIAPESAEEDEASEKPKTKHKGKHKGKHKSK